VNFKTFSQWEDWDHPNEVLSSKDQTQGHSLSDVTNVGDFTTNVGDRLLIIFGAQDTQSGYKLSSDMSSSSSLPVFATMQCHASAHLFQLGDVTNNIRLAYSMGGEIRCAALWIDRATPANSRIALSVANSDPIEFAGINFITAVSSAGSDAGIGEQTFNMKFRGFASRGPVRIIRWAACEPVPPAAEIDIMLEWLWYRWATAEHRILYPPLRVYQ